MAGSIVGSIFNYTSECLYTLHGEIVLTPVVSDEIHCRQQP